MKWKLIIFDCDGVLVDSEPVSCRVLSEALTEIGLPMTFEETVSHFVGRSMAMCLKIIEELMKRPVPANFVDDYYTRMFEAFQKELKPVPGIVEVLDRISTPFCVASSGDHSKIRTTLGLTGLLPRFENRIFSATDVERGKPHPDLFLHAANRMGTPAKYCAVVEDTVLGVQAAIAAGMTVFGYAKFSAPEVLTAAGANVFFDMRDLL